MDLNQLLRFAVDNKASDIHIQANLPPCVRIAGTVHAVNLPVVTHEELLQLIGSIAPPHVRDHLDKHLFEGLDFAYASPELGRFRCAVFRHMGLAGMVMRVVLDRIPSIVELNLPEVIRDIALSRRGLTLVSGTAGSGKSTTLAAMIELINENVPAKILCIGDPIEFLHTPKQAMITHLEVGLDTPSFEHALRQGLRQDPDVILIGELRDGDTLRVVLRAADTGHQVLATVHAGAAPQTVERIIAMLPASEHRMLLEQFVGSLNTVISQRLVNCRDGIRRPVTEILRGGPVPTKYILEGRIAELHEYMQTGGDGQQTFDQELLAMFRKELLSAPEAKRHATHPQAVSIALRSLDYAGPSSIETKVEGSPESDEPLVPDELPLAELSPQVQQPQEPPLSNSEAAALAEFLAGPTEPPIGNIKEVLTPLELEESDLA